MTEELEERKPRSVYTTNTEWEAIRKEASNARQSITQYILTQCLDKNKRCVDDS